MTDLETILRNRADHLRGRPESWRDRARDRWERFDFVDCMTVVMGRICAVMALPAFAVMIFFYCKVLWEFFK